MTKINYANKKTFIIKMLIIFIFNVHCAIAQNQIVTEINQNNTSENTSPIKSINDEYDDLIAQHHSLSQNSADLLQQVENNLPNLIQNASPEDATQAELLKASTALDQSNKLASQANERINALNVRMKNLSATLDQLNAREQILNNPASVISDKKTELTNIATQKTLINVEQNKIETYKRILIKHLTLIEQLQALQNEWLTKLQTLNLAAIDFAKNANGIDHQINANNTEDPTVKALIALQKKLETPNLQTSELAITKLSLEALKLTRKISDLSTGQKTLIEALKTLEQLLNRPKQPSDVIQTAISSLKKIDSGLQSFSSQLNDLNNERTLIEQNATQTNSAFNLSANAPSLQPQTSQQKTFKNIENDLINHKNGLLQLQKDNDDAKNKIHELNNKIEALALSLINTELTNYASWPNDQQEWIAVFNTLTNAPKLFINQIKESIKVGLNQYTNATDTKKISFFVLQIIILLVGIFSLLAMTFLLSRMKKRGTLSQYPATQGILTLFSKNILSITIALLLVSPLLFFKVPEPGRSILLILNLSWFILKFPISICYYLMVSTPHTERRDLPLFRLILFSLFSLTIIGICIYMAHLLGLPQLEIDTLHRVLSFWLILMQWPLKRFHLYSIRTYWTISKRESNRKAFAITNMAHLILRISIIVIGIAGLIGFINLASLLAYYMGIFITISILWEIVRNLLADGIHFVKEWAMINTKMGILWAQDIINPLHKLLNLFSFIYIWLIFPLFIGIKKDSALTTWISSIINNPIINIGNTDLSLKHIVVALFLIVSIFSFAKWLRAISFRWILAKVTDIGVRHSLSVFVQYIVVISGFIILLNMLRIDLTTLTVFAGALGVGIGFGLQTIANNLVSGILLLIERPLRSGDIVEIANQTGVIDRIGIRSITMKTFDHTDVIIPNSSVISGSFVNWTHQNNNIRTLFMVGVSYLAPPEHVIELISEIIKNEPGVLQDESPSVFLDEFAASAINYRISYFVDMSLSNRNEIKSNILIKIYNRLAEHHYELPYPQRVIHMK